MTTLPFTGVGESGCKLKVFGSRCYLVSYVTALKDGYQIMKYGFEGFTHRRSTVDVPKEYVPHFSFAPWGRHTDMK